MPLAKFFVGCTAYLGSVILISWRDLQEAAFFQIACLGGDRQGRAKGRRDGGEDGGDLPWSNVRAFRSNPSPATSRSDFGDARALPGDRRTFAGEACTSTTSTLMSIQFESSDETSSASSR